MLSNWIAWSVIACSRWSESLTRLFVASVLLGIAVVVVLELTLRLVRRTTARMRFLMLGFGFVLLAVLPVVAFVPWRTCGEGLAPALAAGRASGTASVPLDIRWALGIALLWVGASLTRAVVLLAQAIRLWRVARSAEALRTEPWMRAWSSSHRWARSWRFVATDAVESPCVIGFFSPRILIPSRLAASIGAEQLRPVVLHELAHLGRWDDWTNLLQKLALVVFPLHPGLHWLDRALSRERELACDEAVVAEIESPRVYASCLVEIAAFGLERSTVALPFGRLRSRSELSARVTRILNPVARLRPATSLLLAVGIAGGTLLFSIVLLRLTPVVSFAPDIAASVVERPAEMRVDRAMVRPVVFHSQPTPQPVPRSTVSTEPQPASVAFIAWNGERSRVRLGLSPVTEAVPVVLHRDVKRIRPTMDNVVLVRRVSIYLVLTEVEQTSFVSAQDGTTDTARITQTVFSVMTTVEHTGEGKSLRPEWMSLQL